MQTPALDLIDSTCPYEAMPCIEAEVERIAGEIEAERPITDAMIEALHELHARTISMLANHRDGAMHGQILPSAIDDLMVLEERIDVLLQAIEDEDLPDA